MKLAGLVLWLSHHVAWCRLNVTVGVAEDLHDTGDQVDVPCCASAVEALHIS